jgi:hypothetical protein
MFIHKPQTQNRRPVNWNLSHFQSFFSQHSIDHFATETFPLLIWESEEVQKTERFEFVLSARAIPQKEVSHTDFQKAKSSRVIVTQKNV